MPENMIDHEGRVVHRVSLQDIHLGPPTLCVYSAVMHHNHLVIMVQCHTVELQEGIGDLSARCCHSRVQRHTLQMTDRAPDFDTAAVFDGSEIDRVECSALMGYHRRLHMTEECPRYWAEERMILDV